MVYASFLENIKMNVQERLGPDFYVGLQQVLKNNGLLLDGLSILSKGATLAPTIYLNAYYDEAENGLPLSVIAEQIILLYEEQDLCSPGFCEQLEHFDEIKERIVYKLINASNNEKLLEDIPHFPFLDLAVVFYLMLSGNSEGQMTAQIHNNHLTLWNITAETLLALADQNTPRLIPAKILPIELALAEAGLRRENNDLFSEYRPVALSVLTNQNGINGASCMLYKDVIKNFADREKDDIIILPSSIHEVLLTPYKKAFAIEDLNEMVTLINQSDVPPEDCLSNHAYLYSRKSDRITIPTPSFSTNTCIPLQ